MTKLSTADAERFLARPDPSRSVILFYGPDPGGVADRASQLTERLVGTDSLSIVRLDADELGADPARLADEAYGISLFAQRKVIRLRALGNRPVAPALAPILDAPPPDTFIVIEAGDLRPTAPLRKLCESHRGAAAIGCYPDDNNTIGRLIDQEVAASNLSIEPAARTLLIELLGADRGASRNEIRKLCLYAAQQGRITIDDVATTVGDGAAFAIDSAVEAAAIGELADLDRALRRLAEAAVSGSSIAMGAERHFLQLHRLRAESDRLGSPREALQNLRPPPFPSRRALLERQLRLWQSDDLRWASARLGAAVLETRLQPGNDAAIAANALFALAQRARRRASAAQPDI